MSRHIPVAVPYIAKNSSRYVNEALDEGAISGLFGQNLAIFEREFADFIGVKHAVSCSSGTSALHLAMAAHGIAEGDEVLVASLTNMATFFAVIYCGAVPIPVDIDKESFCISIEDIERKITSSTKAILVVHLFGQACEMDSVINISEKYGIPVFEDCAQSHGGEYKEKRTGSTGLAGCFSFYANKNINTGEGGMVTTNCSALAARMQEMKSLYFGKKDKFLHQGVGFNYRMDNIKAALGRAQMEEAKELVEMKVRMGKNYDSLLSNENRIITPRLNVASKNVYWMYHIKLIDRLIPKRTDIFEKLASYGIETRPGFVSYTMQPFCDNDITDQYPCPVAESLSYATFYLPSSHDIDIETQEYVVEKLSSVLDSCE